MKSYLLFSLIFLGQILSAQHFTEKMGTPFEGASGGHVSFSDIDGDNDQDVIVTGLDNYSKSTSKLYVNDGVGNFTEVVNTPFTRVFGSSIAFADVDADNDQDLLITGITDTFTLISNLYINDGMGNFSEMGGTPFDGVRGSIAFSDIDNDNDQDVLITGMNNSNIRTSKLYTNDGLGNFTEVIDTPFDGVESSYIAFSDVDGDNDQDVLITGGNGSGRISKLYTNDGMGNFSEVIGTPFDGVTGFVTFSDVDGDNDQDVLITGRKSSTELIAKLYTNDGVGNFSEVMGTPFEGVSGSSTSFSDIDDDGDQDLLISGGINSDIRISKLYSNDGTGNFTEVMNTPFDGTWGSSIVFSDVDGDNDEDLLITGENNSDIKISKLYINDSLSTSIEVLTSLSSFEFMLFPNPTKANKINVSYNSDENDIINFNIFDLKGRLLKQEQVLVGIGKQDFSINISALSTGSYFIQLDNGIRKGVQKLIIK